MNNSDVQRILDACQSEMDQIKLAIDKLGPTNPTVAYLSKYALIRACSTIELSFKTIIVDYCSYRSKKQVKNYIKKLLENSHNPTYERICKILNSFDDTWNYDFKRSVNLHVNKDNILLSLKSLVDARNDFAHGGNPTITIIDILNYYRDSRIIISILDNLIVI